MRVDVTGTLAANTENFTGVVRAMHGSKEGLGALVREVEPIIGRLAEMNDVMAQMRETADAVQQMTLHREQLASLGHSLAQIARAAEAMRSPKTKPSQNGDGRPRQSVFLRWLPDWGSRPRRAGRP